MRIGLTYDLRSEYLAEGYSEEETAEFDRDDTIEALEQALQQLGHETDRVGNVRALVGRLARGDRWDLVFNICEGLRGFAREAQVPAILDAYEIAYTFSDPLLMSLSLHKGLTKTVLRSTGIPTPPFRLVHTPADLDNHGLTFPVFAKPVAEGTGKGITAASKITSDADLRRVAVQLLHEFDQPVLLEEYLPGREFTVCIVGTESAAKVLGTLEIILRDAAEAHAYSYLNKERCEELVEYRRVSAGQDAEVAAAEAVALAAWRHLGCRDAGRVDLRSDVQGRPSLLEVNPLAGLHPQHSDLPMLCTAIGMPYTELVRQIVESAAERIRPAARRAAALPR